MTGTSILYMLLGAVLVAAGVLAAALADRIRGLRVTRSVEPRERASRAPSVHAARTVIPVFEAAPLRSTPAKPRASRVEPKVSPESGGDDVIAALVASGYKKPIATDATWACSAAERATIEGWTAAAFRRCARGGMS